MSYNNEDFILNTYGILNTEMDVLEGILEKQIERKNDYCKILQNKIIDLEAIIKLFETAKFI